VNRWKDWYEQGKRDYERSCLDVQYAYYEWACFTTQKAYEKVLKGLALRKGVTVWGHSLTEILRVLSSQMEVPREIVDHAKLLDMHYIPPRCTNGFAQGKPADYFTEKQAREAINAADRIIGFCEGFLVG